MKVVITAAARDDMIAIGDFIAADNPARARSFVRDLRAAVMLIGEMPLAFPLVARYEAMGVSRRPWRNHLVFYRVDRQRVTVLHVIHGARDYEAILVPTPPA